MANLQFQMPLHGTQNSPKFSRDSPAQLLQYLKDINFLGTLTALDDHGKIRAAICYADLEEAKVWQTLLEAAPMANDWDAFIVAVKGLYSGCEGDDHYCHADLQHLIEEYQSKPMQNQDDLREYQQKFAKISTLLIKTKKLAETEWDSMFLISFPRAITDHIHHQLSIVCTDLHPDYPYPLAEVIKAAKFLLTGSVLHGVLPTLATTASPATPPSPACMPQVPPAGTVVKQEYNFQMQHLLQQCRPSCGFCADPNHWTRMCALIEMEAESHASLNASAHAVTPAAPCNMATQGTTNLFCIAHPKVDMQLEIQPSAFLNTIQDVNEPVADLADPDFQAYVAQAWATYQVDKGNKGTVVSCGKKVRFDGVEITAQPMACPANPPQVNPRTATVKEEIISPGIQSSCATHQASEPSASVPISTTVKSYVPLTNPIPTTTCKDSAPMAIVPSQTPYLAACNQNQYCYLFPLEDKATPKHIMECILETSIALPVKELFAVAPEFCKQFRDITMAKCVTTNEIEVVRSEDNEGVHVNELTGHNPQQAVHEYGDHLIRSDNGVIMAHHTLLLCCIEAKAGCSDLHPTTFHTPSPQNQDDGPDPDDPDGDPNGRGSSDRDIPEDLAEPPEDPLMALARAVHALAQSSSHTGDSAPKTKVHEPDTFDGSNPKKLYCIKDEITCIGKPSTLTQLHKLTQTIDACYWEHEAEISHTTKSATNRSQPSSSNNKSKLSSSTSTLKSNAKGKGKQKDLPKSDIAHLLGKDGKLTCTELQHRMKNNLCLFCGEAGHSAKDCPRSTSRTAKAHAAMAGTLPPLPAEKAEPKN
ncbi:hypothetical protein F5J12DRAFT_888328 [Pisolithus orientalis]|uniref:uncharacterized protein n=1 Tax=Pisolithus orientalis TaxID=936130 RepID=UPI0022254320|nr:uncharacterized protein F5J12DRAFT_888328 [Pisolithus orientalis]KAI6030519.1 hypothetical protein F5J12DRAFT_888328 [Pisolithus orientalis]